MADDRRTVAIRWPVDLLAEVDAAAGKGGRTRFVLDAVRAHLAASSAEAKPEPRANPRGVRPASDAKPPPDTPAPGGRLPDPHVRSSALPDTQVRWCATHERVVGPGRSRCAIGGKCRVK